MVHAVCFNKKCFDVDVFERIIVKTGGQDAGYLVNTFQNCIESFPDGKIYRSFQNRNDWITDKGIIDCGDDIEKFIYVNQYGKKGQKDEMDEYDNLVQQLQDGEISTVEFIERQVELSEEWKEWLEDNSFIKNEETATAFLDFRDNMAMHCQNHNF